MKSFIDFFLKYIVCSLLTLAFVTGILFVGFGLFNIAAGNETSGEFKFGLPLIVIGSFSFVIAKIQTKHTDESVVKYLADALFWFI